MSKKISTSFFSQKSSAHLLNQNDQKRLTLQSFLIHELHISSGIFFLFLVLHQSFFLSPHSSPSHQKTFFQGSPCVIPDNNIEGGGETRKIIGSSRLSIISKGSSFSGADHRECSPQRYIIMSNIIYRIFPRWCSCLIITTIISNI